MDFGRKWIIRLFLSYGEGGLLQYNDELHYNYYNYDITFIVSSILICQDKSDHVFEVIREFSFQ